MLQIDARRDASPAADPGRSKVLVLSETDSLEGRKPFLLDHLTAQERDYVIRQCTPKLAKRSSMIFRQGETQKGIFLILSGGVRVFYAAPSGREITRAYWFAGNFISGPGRFAQARNILSAVAMRYTRLRYRSKANPPSLCSAVLNIP